MTQNSPERLNPSPTAPVLPAETLRNSLRFVEAYAHQLTADLTPEQMVLSGGKGHENHPAFTLGHLVTAADMAAQDLGLASEMPEGWAELFGRRGPADRRLPPIGSSLNAYPSREALLAELHRQHGRILSALVTLPAGRLNDRAEPWMLQAYFPTVGETLLFMTAVHAATHLGQLAAWRRALGLPAAMAKM